MTPVNATPNTPIRALGEIALRVNDLDTMQKFYEEVIGLALLKRFPKAAFLRIAEGFGGHTQILALFDRADATGYQGISAAKSTIDHLAFTISLADFAVEKQRLEQLGLSVTTTEHGWVHWRSLYVNDPEGNEVELVCYDASV